MIVNLGSKKYHITWHHLFDEAHQPGYTECIISEIKADGKHEPFVQANARCSAVDQYNKNTGRKLSLQRALLTRVPNEQNPAEWLPVFVREDRLSIWNEYFKMRGNKY
jgi:hypothetical protein